MCASNGRIYATSAGWHMNSIDIIEFNHTGLDLPPQTDAKALAQRNVLFQHVDIFDLGCLKHKKNRLLASDDVDAPRVTFATDVLRKRRRQLDPEATAYVKTTFILPTSNIVERLFSVAKHILTDSRKHMQPIYFEMIVFLRVNKGYWGVDTLADTNVDQ
ncbi:hypothetical protein ACHHYP_09320 [Achlya hypogyna]|uniref:HAT C-terminal dimerisation domain-containing protein n=1 Tax=Achlya hypogyna TaxID=1202772 RepID=A0A1V9YNG1_ACHHY|nr:hypothetical protein ACHHYP_09320 [Achlya hypogyna]